MTERIGSGFRVCVYLASIEGIAPEHARLAEELGTAIGKRGWELVSGGGRASTMGVVGAAARAAGARTTGVIPQSLVDREWADHDSDELLVVDTMRERKAQMESRADAFVALPGGVGTLEELAEVWTSGYLGMHTKPVVVLDPGGHYRLLLEWVHDAASRGFVRPEAIERLVVCTAVDEALDACAAGAGVRHPER